MSLTGLAFLVVYLGGLTLAIVRHPRFGLYTYLAVFYLDPPSRWWGASLPEVRWSMVAALVTMVAALRVKSKADKPSWSSTTPARLLIVFTVWMWIQNAWALAPPEHLEASILFTKYVVLYYLLYTLLDTPEEVGNILLVHVLGCAFLGWLGVFLTGSDTSSRRRAPGASKVSAVRASTKPMRWACSSRPARCAARCSCWPNRNGGAGGACWRCRSSSTRSSRPRVVARCSV